MDFESFQQCKPANVTTSCTPSGDGWDPGWSVQSGEEYLFRINVTNSGEKDILMDEHTTVLLLYVEQGGQGNMRTDFYILKDPTDIPEDEDGDSYVPNFDKLLIVDQSIVLYFGADDAGNDTIQSIGSSGLYSVNLILFGYMDENDNGGYDVGVDKPYSQNLPFQGLYAT